MSEPRVAEEGRRPTEDDHRLAARIATEAGELLLALRAGGHRDEQALRDQGDRQSHELITEALAAERPDDAVLSEEGTREDGRGGTARLGATRVWIVDPLDGTREFGEQGRSDWAVHVALVVDHQPVAGAVALPATGVTFSTADPPPLPPAARQRGPRLLVSRTRPPALATAVAEQLDGELVPLGSAGAKTMAILQGAGDVYLHGGGQYEWDSAAPVAVALAAGLHCSRLDGSPLVYNREDTWLPDLLVCRPELAEAVLAAVAALPGA